MDELIAFDFPCWRFFSAFCSIPYRAPVSEEQLFQFEYVSMTVLPLSIMESTNSLCTESAAGDTPHYSVHFSASPGLGMVKKGLKQVGDVQCSAVLYP